SRFICRHTRSLCGDVSLHPRCSIPLFLPTPLLPSTLSPPDPPRPTGYQSRLAMEQTTVAHQKQTGGDWSSGLFDVCGDMTTCILGALVPCCLDLSLAHQFGECLCLPLLPGSTFAMRVGIRERYKIRQGSVCEDWTTVYCCYPLAVCQMIREVKRRMKTQTYHV
uniref:PLAC8 like 1 n=1 Tax=Tetraodon nigroviridis TaxID=99883 RepID=H3DLI1_TETNG